MSQDLSALDHPAVDIESDDDIDTKALFAKHNQKVAEIKKRQEITKKQGKSNVTLDIKPVGTDVDIAALEEQVRKVKMDGVTWLGSQVLDIAYGIQKIRILCQILDESTSPDEIIEVVQELKDVQSVDVFAFQMAS